MILDNSKSSSRRNPALRRPVLLLLFAALLTPPTLLADGQETGVLVGTVSTVDGTALPGVTVNASAGRAEHSTTTDEEGHFRFALLVPGSYKVVAEMDGFERAEHAVQITGGGKAEIAMVLSLGTTETITVTSEAPMVDKYNVTAGSTVSAEIGEQTAGSTRTYYGVIATMPGVTADSESADIQGTRPSVNGTHFADQAVFIDGVDSSFARYGGSRMFLPTTALTEVSMEAGGSGAEYGRAIGSTTNVIVKSGTNRFHFDALVQRQEVDWAADYDSHPELLDRQNFPVEPDFFRRTEIEEDGSSTGYELSLGGPIRRDRAWFFLAWSDVDTNDLDRTLGGDPVDVSLNTEARIAKLNLQPGVSHQLGASWMDTPASRVFFLADSFDYWTPTPHIQDSTLGTVTWNWSATNDVFMEAKAAIQESNENKQLACFSFDPEECLALKQADRGPTGEGPLRFPANPLGGIHWPGNNYDPYTDSENDGALHNGWILDNGFGVNEFPRDQANFGLTQFLGTNHELKYGIDWQQVEWQANIQALDLYGGAFFSPTHPFGYLAASGNIGEGDCGVARLDGDILLLLQSMGFPAGRANACSWTFLPDDVERGSGRTRNEDLAFYLRDRFTLGDHWTFNLGLRYEDASAENDIGREVIESQTVAPRLSLAYDVKGDGRLLFSANAGRYYAQVNQEWIQLHLRDQSNGTLESDNDTLLFCDGLDVLLGASGLPGTEALIPCTLGGVGYNFPYRRFRSGTMWDLVDQGFWSSDIDPYSKDELILGFEWQFSTNWAVDLKAIIWELDDIISSTVQAGPSGSQFTLVANSGDYPAILRQIDEARGALGGETLFAGNSLLEDYREARYEYEALQLQLNRRFDSGWALYNNITWSETQTTGGGSWANNTSSSYGEDLHVVLTQDHIDQCNEAQVEPSRITGRTRTVPVDCSTLTPFLGQSVSTINRFGRSELTDRPVVLNSFGFKTWSLGRHDLTLGGHFSFQRGLPWQRTEGVATIALDDDTSRNSSITLFVEERGQRRRESTHSLNLSLAWGLPLGGKLRGTVRVEGLNVTDEQDQLYISSRGEVRPVRRDFQRPRQVRASFGVRW